MLFSMKNRRTQAAPTATAITTTTTTAAPRLGFPLIRAMSLGGTAMMRAVAPQTPPEPPKLAETGPKPMRWGAPCWFFFHTLSVKVREESFDQIRNELLTHIYTLCTHLPCPICSDHAKEYLRGINLHAIQTKDQFKDFFFNFHNMVNARKNYPAFDRVDLEPKYEKAITRNMYHNFVLAYQDKSYNPSHISDEFIRMRILDAFKTWFAKNAEWFEA